MHREFDVPALERFVTRLGALSREDWSRLTAQTESLRGDRLEALWRRAELTALSDAEVASWARVPAQVGGVVAAVLEEIEPGLVGGTPSVSVSDLRRPGGRRYLELLADSQDLVEANAPGDEGVAAAVGAAALALAGGIAESGRLNRLFRYLEGVIPLASVRAEVAKDEPAAPPSNGEATDEGIGE